MNKNFLNALNLLEEHFDASFTTLFMLCANNEKNVKYLLNTKKKIAKMINDLKTLETEDTIFKNEDFLHKFLNN